MRLGFSTGALAASDVQAALTLLEGTDTSAIELSALRAGAFPKDRVSWRFESDIGTDYDFSQHVRLA